MMACISICCGVRGVRRERREGGRGECNKLVEWSDIYLLEIDCPVLHRPARSQKTVTLHNFNVPTSHLTMTLLVTVQ